MNIVLVSPNDWGGTNCLMSRGINKLTEHSARSITEAHHPFQYDTDIVLEDIKSEEDFKKIENLIDEADFYCIAQGIPPSILNYTKGKMNVRNSFIRYSGSDVRDKADALFESQVHNYFFWSFTAYDFTMTRCLIQSLHHNTHIIDTNKWRPLKKKIDKNLPIVIYHSPTNNETKGTKQITTAIENLSKKYNIEWSHTGCDPSGTGGQPWAEIMEKKRGTDIFVDSIKLREHGQNTVEAMCFGIPVLTRLSDYYFALYPDTPIINTDKNNIEENLEMLLQQPELRKSIGIKTRKYCEEMFSIERRVPMWINMIEFIMDPTSDPIYKEPTYWQRQTAMFYGNQFSKSNEYSEYINNKVEI